MKLLNQEPPSIEQEDLTMISKVILFLNLSLICLPQCKIISINRENKINFLNFIYRTDDNYIIASSDKKLIKNSINSSNGLKEKKFQYEGELFGLKNQKNILFTKKFGESIFFDKEIFTNKNEDIVATTFDLKNKHLILKSYLLNNKKNIDILAYDKFINKENTNKENPQVSIFTEIKIVNDDKKKNQR